tara:strand:- start:220 stop:456 length:237 start_codon:yes stop_codon:yes gene_type:complete
MGKGGYFSLFLYICITKCTNKMKKETQTLTFRENKKNTGLIDGLKMLSKAQNRRLNDYLNIILSEHIKQQIKPLKNGN